MQILVSDTSCLIDMRKASLLGAFVQLNNDEMYNGQVATVNQLYSALLLFKQDSTVRLPVSSLNRQIEKYKSLL